LTQLLLAYRPNINLPCGPEGVTPLHIASAVDAHPVVQALLLAPGLDLNLSDYHGATALDFAMKFKNDDIAKTLRQSGAYAYHHRRAGFNDFGDKDEFPAEEVLPLAIEQVQVEEQKQNEQGDQLAFSMPVDEAYQYSVAVPSAAQLRKDAEASEDLHALLQQEEASAYESEAQVQGKIDLD
jgi:ankyrin repeat protein